jgi:hypothetical protein
MYESPRGHIQHRLAGPVYASSQTMPRRSLPQNRRLPSWSYHSKNEQAVAIRRNDGRRGPRTAQAWKAIQEDEQEKKIEKRQRALKALSSQGLDPVGLKRPWGSAAAAATAARDNRYGYTIVSNCIDDSVCKSKESLIKQYLDATLSLGVFPENFDWVLSNDIDELHRELIHFTNARINEKETQKWKQLAKKQFESELRLAGKTESPPIHLYAFDEHRSYIQSELLKGQTNEDEYHVIPSPGFRQAQRLRSPIGYLQQRSYQPGYIVEQTPRVAF